MLCKNLIMIIKKIVSNKCNDLLDHCMKDKKLLSRLVYPDLYCEKFRKHIINVSNLMDHYSVFPCVTCVM